MTGLLDVLQHFHFIRPGWLLLIPAILFFWWRIRSRATAVSRPPGGVAPHLAAALTVGGGAGSRFLAIDGVALAAVLISGAAAGPTWSRIPNPLVAQTAPLAVALKVSESMLAADVAPNRLERAKHKILDVLAARNGARTALIAYAGTAHRVAPLTEDPEVLKLFLEGLSPAVMPKRGRNASAALELAAATLAAEETPGAILFVLDEMDSADVPAFERHAADNGPPVVFLSVAGDDAASSILSRVPGATIVRVTPDASDVAEIDRRVLSAWRDALSRDERQNWADRGWLLAWPALLLVLIWFRRGWAMRWCIVGVIAVAGLPVESAHAGGIADWFLTPDQQGRLAYEERDYARAATLFADPMWQGQALYRAGKYEEAAAVYARVDSAGGAFSEGLALVRNRQYRDGIAAFEKALEYDPGHVGAAHNLDVTRTIVDYIERVREQSDTGEEAGIGADEVVFDNRSQRGTETEIAGETQMKPETAEQWMRTVDTNTADFLRTRFALEAAENRP